MTPSTRENVATAGEEEDEEAEGEERSVTESRENSSCSSFFRGEASIAGNKQEEGLLNVEVCVCMCTRKAENFRVFGC